MFQAEQNTGDPVFSLWSSSAHLADLRGSVTRAEAFRQAHIDGNLPCLGTEAPGFTTTQHLLKRSSVTST